MGSTNGAGGKLNVFALVIYIPDPLGRFLDDLRVELVPSYKPHAHVSVLPPRALSISSGQGCGHARQLAAEFAPFEIELGDVEVFEATKVIYLSVKKGHSELREMYGAVSCGCLEYREVYPYHPHITLAQEFLHDDVERLADIARERWRGWRGPRSFRADTVTFVQNTVNNEWIDLAEIALGAAQPVR